MENGILKKAKEYAKQHVIITQVRQRKPITIVDVALDVEIPEVGVQTFCDWNFAKVHWPDKFDENEGIGMARRKAAGLIAKKMIEAGWMPFDKET